MDTWLDDVKSGDVMKDEATGELVKITNGICVLSHNPLTFKDTHKDGGCMVVPFEGLVIQMDGPTVVTWRIQKIQGRKLVKMPQEVRESVEAQMAQIMDDDKKQRRRKKK